MKRGGVLLRLHVGRCTTPVDVRKISPKLTYQEFISLPVMISIGVVVSESKFSLDSLFRVICIDI
jgi:hypothetical protein